jgi:hypothetical protein
MTIVDEVSIDDEVGVVVVDVSRNRIGCSAEVVDPEEAEDAMTCPAFIARRAARAKRYGAAMARRRSFVVRFRRIEGSQQSCGAAAAPRPPSPTPPTTHRINPFSCFGVTLRGKVEIDFRCTTATRNNVPSTTRYLHAP